MHPDPEPRTSSSPDRGRLLAAAGIAVLAAAIVVVLVLRGGESQARSALDSFLADFEAGDLAGAAAATDGPRDGVEKALQANVEGLDGATLDAEVTAFEESDETAEATVAMRWEVPAIGEYAYETRIDLEGEGEDWAVRWRPQVVHPELEPGTRLGTERIVPERAPILDRDGIQLVRERQVVEIGILPGRLPEAEVDAAVRAVAAATEADAKTLRRSLAAAESPDNFVPAITLRAEEFARIEDELGPIPGIEFGWRNLPLAPTREFARALLGTVGPVTAEQLEELGEGYAVGDNVGQSGLQAAFEEQLAGTPDRAVVIRDVDGAAPAIETLHEVRGERGRPLRTTLDLQVQEAAEAALGDRDETIALVALEPATGEVLAAASRPFDDAFNRAFEGQYPPGSTFKVISTKALLSAGLDPDETVECPATIEAGGRFYRNFEGSAAGAVPFRTDFAESCNTAFVSLSERLGPDDLASAAESFGFGREIDPGVPAFSGEVPRTTDPVDQASSMIGQGRILASPLAMAGVAASVVDGRWHAPRVLAEAGRQQGPPLPAQELTELRSLMRDVVTSGTGTALADVEGEPIGKSGTAEYGAGDPPPTHAWFIAGRDDVAVAVLVEDAPSGGEFAAPIAADFLARLGT